MFHRIAPAVLDRMRHLEQIDAVDRVDGTPRMERLRQIPPETGRLLAILAAGAPDGALIEIGTSAGYSTLWLALAGEATGRRLSTFEVLPGKVELARETFRAAGVSDLIDLVAGNALDHLNDIRDVGFCFLDAEKEIYQECYEAVVPNLVPGGLLVVDNALRVADNTVDHQAVLQPMLDRALSDPRVDAVVVPIGMGELICRKI